MLVLQKLTIGGNTYSIVEISRIDGPLYRQLSSIKQGIMTKTASSEGVAKASPYDTTYLALLAGAASYSQVLGGAELRFVAQAKQLTQKARVIGKTVEVVRLFLVRRPEVFPAEAKQLLKFLVYGVAHSLLSEGQVQAFATIRQGLFRRLLGWGVPISAIGPVTKEGRLKFVPALLFKEARTKQKSTTKPPRIKTAAQKSCLAA